MVDVTKLDPDRMRELLPIAYIESSIKTIQEMPAPLLDETFEDWRTEYVRFLHNLKSTLWPIDQP